MRTPRTRWLALALAAVSACALIGATVIVRSLAASRWDEMQRWVAERERAWDARDFERPALCGDTRPGRAFDHYAEAERMSAELSRRRGESDLLRDVLLHPEEVPAEDVDALRARWSPVIEAMRAGAHCADVQPPRRFEEGYAAEATNLLAGRWVCNSACFEARRLLAADRGDEAVGWTLDAATYGADLVESPLLIDHMIGMALIAIATQEFWTTERLAQLDDSALTLLADGLARLDDRLPVTPRLEGEALLMAHGLTASIDLDDLEIPSFSTWSYGFSTRWMIADAVLEVARSIEELSRTADRPWPERDRAIRAQFEALSSSGNPIVRVSWANLGSWERTFRHVVTQVRMLRTAIDVRRGLPITPFEDPLGDGPLEIVDSADGPRVLSAGHRGEERLERALPAPR